ncbi:MAG: hypothetical protein ACYC21_00585 [Eubacteriales bacterium]
MRKHLPLMTLIVVVVMVIGYLGFTSLTKKKTQPTVRDKIPPAQIAGDDSSAGTPSKSGDMEKKVSPQAIEQASVPNADTKLGELIVWGEIKAVDVDKWVLTIDQQMDDNSVKINPNVPVNKNAIIRNKEEVISLAQVKPGDSVGIIVTKTRQARAVLVNY